MLERYTEATRTIMGLARQHSVRLQHGWIGSVHILLALLEDTKGIAGRALRERGLTLDYAIQAVRALTPPEGPVEGSQALPHTPDAEELIERAGAVAEQPDGRRIRSEHLLLGLLTDSTSAASRVLLALDADPEQIKQTVYELIKDGPARSTAPSGLVGDDELALVERSARSTLQAAHDLIRILQRSDPGLQQAAELTQQALAALEQQLPAAD